jgi:hypothetical protein
MKRPKPHQRPGEIRPLAPKQLEQVTGGIKVPSINPPQGGSG